MNKFTELVTEKTATLYKMAESIKALERLYDINEELLTYTHSSLLHWLQNNWHEVNSSEAKQLLAEVSHGILGYDVVDLLHLRSYGIPLSGCTLIESSTRGYKVERPYNAVSFCSKTKFNIANSLESDYKVVIVRDNNYILIVPTDCFASNPHHLAEQLIASSDKNLHCYGYALKRRLASNLEDSFNFNQYYSLNNE